MAPEGGPVEEKTAGTFQRMLISLIISMILIGFHAYIALVVDRMIRPDYPNLTVLIYSILISFPFIILVGMILSHTLGSRLALPFSFIAGLTMALFQYMFLWAVIAGPIVLIFYLLGIGDTINDLSTTILSISTGIILTLLLCGFLDALRLRTTRKKITISSLGGREVVLGVIADLHLGPLVGKRRIAQIRSALDQERPDIIIMAGDLFDTAPGNVRRMIPSIEKLWKVSPTYGVMGNHEFINGTKECDRAIREMGITLLRGEMVTDEKIDIDIIGIDDPHGERIGEGHRTAIGAILEKPTDRPTILINHQPIEFREAAELGVSLQISGHTHGGQLWPNHLITRRVFRDGDRGLISKYGSHMFISLGAGTWGPPIRIGNPPEIAFLTLHG